MASLKDEFKSFAAVLMPGKNEISLLKYCSQYESVTRSIWEDRVGACNRFFSGGTDEEDEDTALRIIMKCETYAELAFMVNRLTWDVLDDELDEADLTQIAGRLSQLRNRVEGKVATVLRELALRPETFASSQSAVVDQAILDRLTWLGASGRQTLADSLIARRVALLDSIALCNLRSIAIPIREFRFLIDRLTVAQPKQADELTALFWEALYDNLVCSQLEGAHYRVLLTTLPDLVDAGLPEVKRRALFDTLNRRDGEFRAMQDFIMTMGTIDQRTSVQRFMDARQVFMDNFTPAAPTAGIIQQIAQFFASVASEIAELRAAVVTSAQSMIDALSLEHLLSADSDDVSRKTVGLLDGGQRLALLPTRWKEHMVHFMEEGNCDDDDEQAIARIFTVTKDRSLAEFAQLVNAQGWESLSSSFDGQEYDDLENLCSSW